MFATDWDVDKYKNQFESDEHWELRRQFMLAHKLKFAEDRLVCLAQVFFNMEFLGCKYPEKTMNLVNQLTTEVAKDFRESRENKLKRTFVGAQEAVHAKVKGDKPPTGSLEGHSNKRQILDSDVSIKQESANLDQNTQEKEIAESLRECSKMFVLMIPPRANSKTEQDPIIIMHYNFPGHKVSFSFHGSKNEGGWRCEVRVNPYVGELAERVKKPKHLIAAYFSSTQREAKRQAATLAVEGLRKHCTVLDLNPEWFMEGKTPVFITERIPCTRAPRSYLILTKKDTGRITPEVADTLIKNFKMSSNEDMFFPVNEFSEQEKINLLNRSQTHKIGFRHFGENTMLKDHNVCIYKEKRPEEILQEASKMGWKHPKYIVHLKNPLTSPTSPPRQSDFTSS